MCSPRSRHPPRRHPPPPGRAQAQGCHRGQRAGGAVHRGGAAGPGGCWLGHPRCPRRRLAAGRAVRRPAVGAPCCAGARLRGPLSAKACRDWGGSRPSVCASARAAGARAFFATARPQGYEVDIYEARPFIGGKVASYRDKDGNDIEMGLHVFFGAPPPAPQGCRGRRRGRRPAGPARAARGCSRRAGGRLRHPSSRPLVRRRRCHPPPAGCYFNLFRLMAKCGVLENLLLKEHTHTFCNKVGRGGSGRARAVPGLSG